MPGSEYSNDLKSRIHHLALMGFAARETSIILAIPESTVYRVLACETGSFTSDRNQRTGRPRELSREDIEFLLHISKTQPDLYLDELKEELELEGMSISLASLCRYLHRNGVTHKRQYDTAQLVSVDEAAVDARNMNRTFGWSYSGRCATIEVAYERGTRYSILPAISLDGVIHANIVQGSFNAITFRHFISSLLDRMNPFPGPNSVILLDNASIHHSRETLDMIEARGMRYIHLPPYSPDFQPIEELFHQLKDWIRRNYREGRAAMDCVNGQAHPFVFLMEGLDNVSCEDVEGFFRDTGYPVM